jgi:hypothetical protein
MTEVTCGGVTDYRVALGTMSTSYLSSTETPGNPPTPGKEKRSFFSSLPHATQPDWDVLSDAHDWSGDRVMC